MSEAAPIQSEVQTLEPPLVEQVEEIAVKEIHADTEVIENGAIENRIETQLMESAAEAIIESESAPEESAANLTFEVEKPQEPIEDVPAAKVEEAESLEAVVNNSETPLEIVQDEPIKVEEKVEEP